MRRRFRSRCSCSPPERITCVIGMLSGCRRSALSGLYLALITLMFAGATTIVLYGHRLPERRRRLPGLDSGDAHDEHAAGAAAVDRRSRTPRSTATRSSSRALFLLALIHVAAKPGRAWASIRESEPAALAAGRQHHALQALGVRARVVRDRRRRLPARGAGRQSRARSRSRRRTRSTLAATALIGGIYSLWGAIVAGVFSSCCRSSSRRSGASTRTSVLIIFGAGLLQVLLTAPGGLSSSSRRTWRARAACLRPRRAGCARPRRRRRRDRGRGPDRPLRGRDAARRRERRLPERNLRPDRPERRRQDDVLQRPQRLRPAGEGSDPRASARTCSRWPTSGARAGGCAGRSRPSRRSRSSRSSRTSR